MYEEFIYNYLSSIEEVLPRLFVKLDLLRQFFGKRKLGLNLVSDDLRS